MIDLNRRNKKAKVPNLFLPELLQYSLGRFHPCTCISAWCRYHIEIVCWLRQPPRTSHEILMEIKYQAFYGDRLKHLVHGLNNLKLAWKVFENCCDTLRKLVLVLQVHLVTAEYCTLVCCY